MIQEISPHHFSNHFQADATIGEEDFILHYRENTMLLKTHGDEFELPQKKDFPEISGQTAYTFLFSLNDIPCFLIWDDLTADGPPFVYKDINFFRTALQQEIAWISIAGLHLMNWYEQNKFCGKCGTKTEQKQDERAIICPECGSVVYPKISPDR